MNSSQPGITITPALRAHMASKNETAIAVDIIDCVN